MHKTTFAGLTALDPGENPNTSGAPFFGPDRDTIDHFLQIGAVTHRHDAHAALANPTVDASAVVTSAGGLIPADVTMYVGYTLVDTYGGETILSPVDMATTPPGTGAPLDAPDAVIDYTGGTLLANTYYYVYTLTDGLGGETPPSPLGQVTRDPGFASGQVLLSGLTADFAGTGATGWRLYRATGGGEYEFLDNGTTDAFTDDGTIPVNCDVHPPATTENTTGGTNLLTIVVPSAGTSASGVASFNVYVSEDGTFVSPALVGNFPLSSAGLDIDVTSLTDLLSGQPPAVSTSIPGANKIDPDTELIDWHWKRPVATLADLPSDAENGDVRITLDEGKPYRFVGSAWGAFPLGSATVMVSDGSATVAATSDLEFRASGSVHVAVSPGAGGAAVIEIGASAQEGPQGPAGAPGAPGATGPTGSAIVGVGDFFGDQVNGVSEIRFQGSGNSLVTVAASGSNSAVVTVYSSAQAASSAHTPYANMELLPWNYQGSAFIGLIGSAVAGGSVTYWHDDFSANDLSSYTADPENGPSFSITGGTLVNTVFNGGTIVANTAPGAADYRLRVKIGTNNTSQSMGFTLSRLDSNNKLWVYVQGTNFQFAKWDGGSFTSLSTVAKGGGYSGSGGPRWFVCEKSANTITVYEYGADPLTNPGTPVLATASYTLAGANATKFGSGVIGLAGLVVPGNAGGAATPIYVDDFYVESLVAAPGTYGLYASASGANGTQLKKVLDDTGDSDYLLPNTWQTVGGTGAAYSANWSNYGSTFQTVAYRREGPVVRLRGRAKKASAPAAGDVIFVLPSGFQPTADTDFMVITGADSGAADTVGRVIVRSNGNVEWASGYAGANANPWTALNGLTFSVA